MSIFYQNSQKFADITSQKAAISSNQLSTPGARTVKPQADNAAVLAKNNERKAHSKGPALKKSVRRQIGIWVVPPASKHTLTYSHFSKSNLKPTIINWIRLSWISGAFWHQQITNSINAVGLYKHNSDRRSEMKKGGWDL